MINLKFLLFCYEELSGMKINYMKSEVYTVGLSEQESQRVADAFNCNLGSFPMKYLGLPISERRLSKSELSDSADKMEKRLQTWKCGHLSSGGKSILINSSLTSIPMYTMGFYWLYEGIHQRFDSCRSKFFWEGVGNKKKFHMIKWEALDKPKEFGGLGFIDTRVMNIALLCKWIFRLESGEDSLCMNLLRRKYLKGKGFYQSRKAGSSQFWQGLHDVKDWYERGKAHVVGSGQQTRFWIDVWLGECTLKIQYPKLYKICHDQEISVQAAAAMEWNLSYRRRFGDTEMKEWEELMTKLEEVNLTNSDDRVCWKLEQSGKYSTRSLYRFITFAGVIDVQMREIWNAKIPLKVQVFLWMAWHDRIQTVQQLRKRNWVKAQVCKFCEQEESVNHLLFQCPIAVAVWCWVRDSLGWHGCPFSISSFESLLANNRGGVGGSGNLFWWLMAAVGWALWKSRNELVFSDIVIKSPKQVAYRVLGFLQQWTLLEMKEVNLKNAWVDKLKDGMVHW
jgi:hypothetical protein